MNWKKMSSIVSPALALALGLSSVARANLVSNGSFESVTDLSNNPISTGGQVTTNVLLTDWTVPSGGYTFVFPAGSADTTGVPGQYGTLSLWGPNNGSANGLPASSPDGGNFVGQDGAYQDQPIQQTVSGLTVGQQYSVSFYWAAAQQEGYTGATTEQWQVSLGSETETTAATLSIPSMGFSGWQQTTLTFTADSTSDVLSFLAFGTPSGVPPFALLDGVDMEAVPEPSTVLLLGAGLAGLGLLQLRRRMKLAAV
jgi:hypothetical protein